MEIPSEILARAHLAKAEEYWLADRLEPAEAAMALALNTGMSPSDVYDRQRTIDAELAARRKGVRLRIAEHLITELPAHESAQARRTLNSVAADVWRWVTDRLQVRWGKPGLITVFPDYEASLFLHARYGYYAERSESHKICLPYELAQSSAAFHRALLHECTHAALHNHAGDAVPRWFDEGVAVWMEGGCDALEKRQLRLRAAHGDVPTLAQVSGMLSSYRTELDSVAAGVSYAVAGSFVAYLAQAVEAGGIVGILTRLRNGETFERAFRRVAGRDLAAVERDWRRSLGLSR